MDTIIRGTTPTIEVTFSEVAVNAISVAVLTLKQNGSIVIEKTLDTATVGEDSISWKLTQEETFSLEQNVSAVMCCDWRLADGTRGRSRLESCRVDSSGKEEVI